MTLGLGRYGPICGHGVPCNQKQLHGSDMMLFGWEITEPVDLVAGWPPDSDHTVTPPS